MKTLAKAPPSSLTSMVWASSREGRSRLNSALTLTSLSTRVAASNCADGGQVEPGHLGDVEVLAQGALDRAGDVVDAFLDAHLLGDGCGAFLAGGSGAFGRGLSCRNRRDSRRAVEPGRQGEDEESSGYGS